MNRFSLKTPWDRPGGLYSAPRHLTFKLALGEAPAGIPAQRDVRLGVRSAPTSVDGGAIDRILRSFAGRIKVTRIHTASAQVGTPGHGHERFDDLEHALGLSRVFRVVGESDFNVGDCVDALQQFDRVEAAAPMYLATTPQEEVQVSGFDPDAIWRARAQIHGLEAMAYEPGDPAVLVAVVDTGVAARHSELSGRLRPGYDTVELGDEDLATGLTLLGDERHPDADPEDEVGHGTSCATIIGGRGAAIAPGLAHGCGLFGIRVLGAAKSAGRLEPVGIGSLPDIDAGLKCAVDLGARVLNLSFGTPNESLREGDPLPHADLIRYALARGCVLVAASGNSGRPEPYSPAVLPGVIAVGAVDGEDRVSPFTTRGAHVALCAPGERVLTAGLAGYQLATGTSFAAPFVTATAALMVSRALRRSRALDGPTVRELLIQSARPHSRGQGPGAGSGVLDAHAALAAVDRWIDQTEAREEATTHGGRR